MTALQQRLKQNKQTVSQVSSDELKQKLSPTELEIAKRHYKEVITHMKEVMLVSKEVAEHIKVGIIQLQINTRF